MQITPATARILPFGVYIGFLAFESVIPEAGVGFDKRWLYALKTACVVAALAFLWRRYEELAGAKDVSAIDWMLTAIAGAGIFVLWINLDQAWAMFGQPGGWNPSGADGQVNWSLVAVRIAGAALVVPVMEELFWRSLVMRWIKRPEFLTVTPRSVGAMALLVSSALFALEHHQWLAGLLAGLAYAALYMRSGNLWTAIVAHGITNLLLGVWVLYTRQWQFW